MSTQKELLRKAKIKKVTKYSVASLAIAGATAGSVVGVIASHNSSKLPTWKDGNQLRSLNYASLNGEETSVKNQMKMDAYYLDGDGNTFLKVKDVASNWADAQKIIKPKVDQYQQEHGVPLTFVYKFGETEFKNNYIDVFNEDQWVDFVYWFLKDQFYGPEIFALNEFSIKRGLNKDGGMVTLGQHEGSRDQYHITFYPDSFFGTVPVYSSEPSDYGKSLVEPVKFSELYGLEDNLLTSLEDKIGLLDLKRRAYAPAIEDLAILTPDDDILASILKKHPEASKYLRSIFSMLDEKKDPYYQTMSYYHLFNTVTGEFSSEFDQMFLKRIYAQWYSVPRYQGNPQRVTPVIKEFLPESSIDVLESMMSKVGIKIFDKKFIKSNLFGEKEYQVYYEKFPKLIEKLGKELPSMITRQADDKNKLSLSANIPALYLKNYSYNEDTKEYEKKADTFKPGVEWLKYVTQHEYGHHITLNAVKDVSEGEWTYSGTSVEKSARSYSATYNKQLLSEYLKRRGVIAGEGGIPKDSDFYDEVDPSTHQRYSQTQIGGTSFRPGYYGHKDIAQYKTFEEFFTPVLRKYIDNLYDETNHKSYIYVDYTNKKVYFDEEGIDLTATNVVPGSKKVDITDIFKFDEKAGEVWQIAIPKQGNTVEESSKNLVASLNNLQKLAIVTKAGKATFNINEMLSRSFDDKSATINPTLHIGQFNGNILSPKYTYELLDSYVAHPDGTSTSTDLVQAPSTAGMQTDFTGWDSTGAKNYHEYVLGMIKDADDNFKKYDTSQYFSSSHDYFFFKYGGKTYYSVKFQQLSNGSYRWLRIGLLISQWEEQNKTKFDGESAQQVQSFVSFALSNGMIAQLNDLSPAPKDAGNSQSVNIKNKIDYMLTLPTVYSQVHKVEDKYWDQVNSFWCYQFGATDVNGEEIPEDKRTQPIRRLEPTYDAEIILAIISNGANSLSFSAGNSVASTIQEQGGYPQIGQMFADYATTFPEVLTRDLNQIAYSPSAKEIYSFQGLDGRKYTLTERNSGYSIIYDPIIVPSWSFDYQNGIFTTKYVPLGNLGGVDTHPIPNNGFFKWNNDRIAGQPAERDLSKYQFYAKFEDPATKQLVDLATPGFFANKPTSATDKPAYTATQDLQRDPSNNNYQWDKKFGINFCLKQKLNTSDSSYVYWNYYDTYYDANTGEYKPLGELSGFYFIQPTSNTGQGRINYNMLAQSASIELWRFPLEDFVFDTNNPDLGFDILNPNKASNDIEAGSKDDRYVSQIGFRAGDSITVGGRTFHWYTHSKAASGQQDLENPGLFEDQPKSGEEYKEGIQDPRAFSDGDVFYNGADKTKYYFYSTSKTTAGVRIALPDEFWGWYKNPEGPSFESITKPDLDIEAVTKAAPGSWLNHEVTTYYYSIAADGTPLDIPGFYLTQPPTNNPQVYHVNAPGYLSAAKEGFSISIDGVSYQYYENYLSGTDASGKQTFAPLRYKGLFATQPTTQDARPAYVDDTLGLATDQMVLKARSAGGSDVVLRYYETAKNGDPLRMALSGFYVDQPNSYADAFGKGAPDIVRPSILRVQKQPGSDETEFIPFREGDTWKLQDQNYIWSSTRINGLLQTPGWFAEADASTGFSRGSRPLVADGGYESLLSVGTAIKNKAGDEYVFVQKGIAGATKDGWYKVDSTSTNVLPNTSIKIDLNSTIVPTYDDIKANYLVAFNYATSHPVQATATTEQAHWLTYHLRASFEYAGWILDKDNDGHLSSQEKSDGALKNIYDAADREDSVETYHAIHTYEYYDKTQVVSEKDGQPRKLDHPGWYLEQPDWAASFKETLKPDYSTSALPYYEGVEIDLVADATRDAAVGFSVAGRYSDHQKFTGEEKIRRTSDSGWYQDLNSRLAVGWSLYDDKPLSSTTDPNQMYGLTDGGVEFIKFMEDALGIGATAEMHHDIQQVWRDKQSDMVALYGTMTKEEAEKVKFIKFSKNGETRYVPVHFGVGHYLYSSVLGAGAINPSDKNDLLINPGWDVNKDGFIKTYNTALNVWEWHQVNADGTINPAVDAATHTDDTIVTWTSDMFVAGGYQGSFLAEGDWKMEFATSDNSGAETIAFNMGQRTRFNEGGKAENLATTWVIKRQDGTFYHIANKI